MSGVVLDDSTGGLAVVVKPDEMVQGGSLWAPAETGDLEDEGQPAGPAPRATPARAHPAARPAPAGGADAAGRLLAAAGALVETVAAQAVWRYELQRLRTELRMQDSPLSRVRLIDAFVRKAAADSREVAAALERLKREASGAGRRLDDAALMELVRRAFMGETS